MALSKNDLGLVFITREEDWAFCLSQSLRCNSLLQPLPDWNELRNIDHIDSSLDCETHKVVYGIAITHLVVLQRKFRPVGWQYQGSLCQMRGVWLRASYLSVNQRRQPESSQSVQWFNKTNKHITEKTCILTLSSPKLCRSWTGKKNKGKIINTADFWHLFQVVRKWELLCCCLRFDESRFNHTEWEQKRNMSILRRP